MRDPAECACLSQTGPRTGPSVFDCAADVWRDPQGILVARWNWKSAIFSSLMRGGIFFTATASAGLSAALGAMYTELAYRSITAGFYGALTQNFRRAEPRWQASIAAGLGIPVFSHAIEFAIHSLRGTPNLRANILASICFTAVSTLFNLHAMREGILVVGENAGSVSDDIRALPRAIFTFFISPFRRRRI
jgi:hypothetical protein